MCFLYQESSCLLSLFLFIFVFLFFAQYDVKWQINGLAVVEYLNKRHPQSQTKPKILCGGCKIIKFDIFII